MNQLKDVYKKPKKPFSEYVNIGVISVLLVLFLTTEFTALLQTKANVPTSVEPNVVNEPVVCKNENNITPSVAPVVTVKPVVTIAAKKVPKKQNIKTLLSIAQKGTIAAFSQRLKQNNYTEADFNTTFEYVYKHKSRDFLYEIALRSPDTHQYKDLLSRFISATKRLNNGQKQQELKYVKALLKKGYTLQPEYAYANTLIRNRHYDMIKLLIESKNIEVTTQNVYGYTLLHEASAKGHLKLIDFLYAKGGDINKQAKDGVSLLHYPVRLGYALTVTKLLKLGINPNLQATLHYEGLDWNQTAPLHIAALKGNRKIATLLVRNGASLTLKDGLGRTAFDIALEHNNTALIPLLEVPALKNLPVTEDNTTTPLVKQ